MNSEITEFFNFYLFRHWREPKNDAVSLFLIMSAPIPQNDPSTAYSPPGCMKIALNVIFWSIAWISGFFAMMLGFLWLSDQHQDPALYFGAFVTVAVVYALIARQRAKQTSFSPEIKALLLEGWQAGQWSTATEAQRRLLKSHNIQAGDFLIEYWLETLRKEAFTNSSVYEQAAWLVSEENTIQRTVINPVPPWRYESKFRGLFGDKPLIPMEPCW